MAGLVAVSLSISARATEVETWRGLVIAKENRCSEYKPKKHYGHSQKLESEIIRSMGGRIYGPYTGRTFKSKDETDIEHIVAKAEAHDSGLCVQSIETRKSFAGDLLNLTLASPGVNRYQKSGKDATEWLPEKNRCWFADRVVRVRFKYKLTIDRREADALESILSQCTSTELIFHNNPDTGPDTGTVMENTPPSWSDVDALTLWDDNRNGRITCKEARRHGIAPVVKDHPAYPFMRDGDGDGVVCE